MSEAAALIALALSLAAAIARARNAPDWMVASAAALVLLAAGVLSAHDAGNAASSLGPTVGFLAALLVVADGCRRAGLFDALGAAMARGARNRPARLLAMVFLTAGCTTAVLSLDATVVLLTPIVFVTAARLRTSPRPHVYACSHLANSASLLLPISNLTNLLAFRASGLSFTRFAGLMVLPWLAAIAIEWLVLRRWFAGELAPPAAAPPLPPAGAPPVPPGAIVLLAATLAGLVVARPLGVAPVWFAAAGAAGFVVWRRTSLAEVLRAAEPTFLVFVLALGLVVRGAGAHGLSGAVDHLIPAGGGLPALLAVTAVSAVLANLLNNLPATLILLPATAAAGRGPLLAMLIGVGAGPNLTYVGSLATLLWRRVLHAHESAPEIREFVRLGALSVPPVLLASTVALWLALHVL